MNISSLQLIPVNIIAYRSQYGSANPAAVIAPAIASPVCDSKYIVFSLPCFVHLPFSFTCPLYYQHKTNAILPGDDTELLPETYVIFIIENDVLRGNLPIYHVERMIKENGKLFDDKSYII